ncbi:hypothetical protein GQX73_g5167 [Xylaria multiplex]|uniref:Uncharacterized protein n=1 Tax=Xylaria multiplex TaxID=323545 RepID=A0A7C8MR75_9PEZI|nr:hypothetical protein GQX73_g5167 [Xylaria multiplex]
MTESSPTPAPEDFDLNSIHAVVEWLGADGQKRYLYQPDQDPSRQITLDIHFSAGSGAALLKLKAPLGIKARKQKTPLFLYIPGDRISSLVQDVPDAAPEVVRAKLGAVPSRLQLSLSRPADMVGPLVSLAPQNRSHGIMMDCLKLLAQETRLSIYLAHSSLSGALLRSLCNAVASKALKPIDSAAALRSLYGGLGGKVLEGAALRIPAPPTSPPSYDELGPMPPQAPLETASGPATPAKKRRRGSASSAGDRTEADTMATCKKMVNNMMAQFRQEERAYYSSQLQQARAAYSQDLQTIKTEMMKYVDKRLSDLEDMLYSESDVDNQISQHVASFDDLVDVKIEDRVTGIRMELEEFVEEEVTAAEGRVLQRVREANWTVSIEE